MESIGTFNLQGDTVLRKMPEQIRITHHGESLLLDRYTGPVYDTDQGKLQCGDYITFGVHRTLRWLAENPTLWEYIQ
jgi:hypothetical protein